MPKLTPRRINRYVKPPVLGLMLAPSIWLIVHCGRLLLGGALPPDLGFNPIEYINRFTGDWTLNYLLLGLCLTPLSDMTGSMKPLQFRRMVGLVAFYYACLHMLSYVALDQWFDWAAIWRDILKRPYILIGSAAILTLIPLAATSTQKAIKKMGAKRWKQLHRLVYAAGILGVAHYIVLAKGNPIQPWIYAAILAFLLGYRLYLAYRKSVKRRTRLAEQREQAARGGLAEPYRA